MVEGGDEGHRSVAGAGRRQWRQGSAPGPPTAHNRSSSAMRPIPVAAAMGNSPQKGGIGVFASN
jgi:hypothetical protein